MKVHTIDLQFQGVPGVIAAYVVECGDEAILIETGPGSTLERLREGIAACGVPLGAIKKVFVTHVHLDHAGAAGWWAGQGARIYCHPRAQRHLVEPQRLLESARQVYGAAFDGLWGEMLPSPADKVIALLDGETVKVGNGEVTALETPGHARHHHAFAIDGFCFTGDVAGVRLAGQDYLSVAAAPPQFELEPYVQSVRRLRERSFEKLYLTHYGEVGDATAHLEGYESRLRQVAALAVEARNAGESEAAWQTRYAVLEKARAADCGCDPEMWARYQRANGTDMCADGLRLWAAQCE